MIKVVDAAVAKAYGGKKKIHWMEVYAGEKSTQIYGADEWLPKETFDALKEYSVSIKGPMTTPVGGGIRSLNVALRQELDLYQCVRPVQYFKGVPSPLKQPELCNMVIFRENTGGHLRRHRVGERFRAGEEGHQVPAGGNGRQEDPLPEQLGHRHQADLGRRHRAPGARAAIKYAIDNKRKSVTIVHKGNISEVHRKAISAIRPTRSPNANSAASRSTAARGSNCRTAS